MLVVLTDSQRRAAQVYQLKRDQREAALKAWDTRGRGRTELRPLAPVRLKQVRERAWDGEPVPIKTKLSKPATGELGERIAAAYLASRGAVGRTDYMEGRNNFPVDLVAGDEVVEVKAGLASNSDRATQWRLTIGEPGPAERAWLEKLPAEDKERWNTAKAEAILFRKEQARQRVSKDLGRELRARTITMILNPDTKTADIYEFEGWHPRIGWKTRDAELGYKGTFRYEEGA